MEGEAEVNKLLLADPRLLKHDPRKGELKSACEGLKKVYFDKFQGQDLWNRLCLRYNYVFGNIEEISENALKLIRKGHKDIERDQIARALTAVFVLRVIEIADSPSPSELELEHKLHLEWSVEYLALLEIKNKTIRSFVTKLAGLVRDFEILPKVIKRHSPKTAEQIEEEVRKAREQLNHPSLTPPLTPLLDFQRLVDVCFRHYAEKLSDKEKSTLHQFFILTQAEVLQYLGLWNKRNSVKDSVRGLLKQILKRPEGKAPQDLIRASIQVLDQEFKKSGITRGRQGQIGEFLRILYRGQTILGKDDDPSHAVSGLLYKAKTQTELQKAYTETLLYLIDNHQHTKRKKV